MKPKIGIALSSGVVRGISHIGILKVLEREKIQIDFVAGTSIGALIGALYCSGTTIEEMENLVNTAKWKELVDFTIPKTGLIEGKKIETFISKILKKKTFEELDIPLSIVATDLNSGEKVVFSEGDIVKAVKASISMPGVFEPVVEEDTLLVDGGLVDPIPVDIVKSMGADIVIAVDLTIDLKRSKESEKKAESTVKEFFEREFISTEIAFLKDFLPKNKMKLPLFMEMFLNTNNLMKAVGGEEIKIIKYTIRSLDILGHQFAKEKLKYPYIDVIIKPEFENIRWAEFDKTKECISAGVCAAEDVIQKLRKLLEKKC